MWSSDYQRSSLSDGSRWICCYFMKTLESNTTKGIMPLYKKRFRLMVRSWGEMRCFFCAESNADIWRFMRVKNINEFASFKKSWCECCCLTWKSPWRGGEEKPLFFSKCLLFLCRKSVTCAYSSFFNAKPIKAPKSILLLISTKEIVAQWLAYKLWETADLSAAA